jgi:hypothetical protein
MSIASEYASADWGKITMVKEPNELVAARAALKKAEEDLGDPGRFVHLRSAINSLLGVMVGDSPQIEKDIANKLVLTYKSKVLSEVKVILANFDSCEPGSLEHWNKVMEVFVDAGLADDPEFNACKEQLRTKRGNQSLDSLKPEDVEILEKELQAALDSLSAHRSRLLNIKWGIRK